MAVWVLAAGLTLAAVAPVARAAGPGTVPPPGSSEETAAAMLELLSRAGRELSGRRFDSAAHLYRQASALDPSDGQPLVMAGVAAYQANDPTLANRDLALAMRRRLGPEDRELALTFLGLIAEDLRSATAAPGGPRPDPDASLSLATSLGGGYDSNVRQTRRGVLDNEGAAAGPAVGSIFTSAGIDLGLDARLGERTEVELGLEVEQTFYPDRALGDLDFQAYGLRLQVGQRLLDAVTGRLVVSSDLSFSGVGVALKPFQSSVRLEPQLVIGRSASARLRLAGAWQDISTHDPTLAYLSGRRLEGSLTPTFAVAGWLASLTGRVRHDALGTGRTPVAPGDDPGCPGCAGLRVVPYSHGSLGGTFSLSAPYRWRIRPSLAARGEIRRYDDPDRVEQAGQAPAGARLRRDERLAIAPGIALRLGSGWVLDLRYEWSAFASTLTPAAADGTSCAPPCAGEPPSEVRAYLKQTVTLGLTVEWL